MPGSKNWHEAFPIADSLLYSGKGMIAHLSVRNNFKSAAVMDFKGELGCLKLKTD